MVVNLVREQRKKQKAVIFQTVQVFSNCSMYECHQHDHITEANVDETVDEDDSGETTNTEWNGEYPYPCIILTCPTLA